jgi:hypothetical protein
MYTYIKDFYALGADAKVPNLGGITLDKIIGPLRNRDKQIPSKHLCSTYIYIYIYIYIYLYVYIYICI